ncbi:potassium/sodium hyperpolarization-activated cyclic nucleotide-gated channel 1-like isoform X2 [Wyeomyia smithii]|uniref:potassium/sodium hyperpolarization-activated cyclic nucleotide-gated channel 1-like isoform X2 n=1 Tax=Wyeomyia smithii TaxID=174621 RepID=UPI002467B10E|nr:potassium/sodium hyperpolarization-activated cyclic nucleotide-gated channel 1-like isoform X2 [Wyeomyia smithii]
MTFASTSNDAECFLEDHEAINLLSYKHQCSLRNEPHYLQNRIPSSESLVFRARQCFLIDPNHPQTKRFFQSSYTYRSELIRHIKSDYWFIIHPFSSFRFYWEIWLLFYMYTITILIPLEVSFATVMRHSNQVYYRSVALNMAATAEVVINCITGYSKDKYYRNIQFSPWEIFKNYLKGKFIIDFLFAIPVSLLVRVSGIEAQWLTIFLDIYSVILFLKLLTVSVIWRYLMNIFEKLNISMIIYYILRFMMISVLFLHWCACFYKSAVTFRDDPEYGLDPKWDQHQAYLLDIRNGIGARYGLCCKCVSYYLFKGSFAKSEEPQTIFAKMLISICSVVGFSFNFYLFLQIYKLITIMSSTKRKYAEAVSELQAYMKIKQFPMEVKNRLLFYYEKKFEKYYFAEDKILEMLSEPLKTRISENSARRFFEQVPVFKDIPSNTLLKLVQSMEKEIYLPNDIAGTKGSKMYFIYTGSVAIYTQSGKEIAHMYDGNHCGEVSLFLKTKRLVNVIAIEFTQVFVLRRKVFLDLISPDSVLYRRLEDIAKERMQLVLQEEEQYKSHLLMVNAGNE